MFAQFAKLPDWLRNGMLVIAGGLIGWFANQYMDYRTSYKEGLGQNYERFDAAATAVQESLIQFADIARGQKIKSAQDVANIQTRLLTAVSAAEDLQRRMKATPQIIEKYRVATVDLKHASDEVTGPLDAKNLLKAVNGYLVAEKDLRDEVLEQQNAFLY
ncbi:hypothetical protein ELI41_29570 (plasmid) [Rhizobium leguminosarum]|jgi:hypothetical protein|uniref:hypothetical protein n=1 Tax=Rhizobium leguminosarum TaxID=384 RepID=UPI0010325508|nr:hypothetical protein [Rhizobium leguminosarum]TAU80458.1 hypothetical protein ELI41_29570 [Rhizobium leguminosarum]